MIQEHYKCTSTSSIEACSNIKLEWNVHKNIFQDLIEDNSVRSSPIIQTKFYNSSWKIKLKTGIFNPEYLRLYLDLIKADVDLSYNFSYRLSSGKKIISEIPLDKNLSPGARQDMSWGYDKWQKKEYLMKDSNWTTDFLTITIWMRVCSLKGETWVKVIKPIVNPTTISVNPDSEPVLQDYVSLMSTVHSDVTLIVGDKKFPCHKGILALRCTYFATMFGSNFKEATELVIQINKNIETDDFENLLRFIYAGKYPDTSALRRPSLLVAADHFGLLPLVQRCEDYLAKNVNIHDCLELFNVANLCSRPNLKDKVKEFMKVNIEEIMETDSWEILKNQNSTLSFQILESIFKKQKKQ